MKGVETMNVAQKEELIIKLNDERRRIERYLKQKVEPRYHAKLMARYNQIVEQIRVLTNG